MKKILCVDDELTILDMLEVFLCAENFVVLKAINGKTALKLCNDEKPDLILLDWMLSDMSGPDLIRKLHRGTSRTIPVIMLTAKGEEEDKISALDAGADDYLVKPFSLLELKARIKSVLRRTHSQTPKIYKYANMLLNSESRTLTINGHEVSINRVEFAILEHFLQNKNKVYTRSQLLDVVWEGESDISDRTVDVHISRLRKKLKPHGVDPIKSVRGIGYVLT